MLKDHADYWIILAMGRLAEEMHAWIDLASTCGDPKNERAVIDEYRRRLAVVRDVTRRLTAAMDMKESGQ